MLYQKKLYCADCGSENVSTRVWVNPNTEAMGEYGDTNEEDDNYCNDCLEHVRLLTIKELWDRFSCIDTDSEGNIKESFLNFQIGTPSMDVIHWFMDRLPNGKFED